MAGIRGYIGALPGEGARMLSAQRAILTETDQLDRVVMWQTGPGTRSSASTSDSLASAERGIKVVFDGALTNADELRTTLSRGGRDVGREDDRAVVRALYEEYGPAFVHLLRGSFAIAVWDATRKMLCLARDQLGTRALYHWRSGNRFAFSTDLGSLLAMPGVSREPDALGILDYLSLGGTVPPRTMFRDVRKLAAGYLLFWNGGHASVERYWAPVLNDVDPRVPPEVLVQEWERGVEALLPRLSRGAVVCLDEGPGSRVLAAQLAKSSRETQTDFVAFNDSGGRAALVSARRLAGHLGGRHADRSVELDDVSQDLIDMIQGGVIPGDEAIALEYRRFREIRSSFDAALRGEGVTALLGTRDWLGHALPGTRGARGKADDDWRGRALFEGNLADIWVGAPVISAWREGLRSSFAQAAAGGGEDAANRAIATELGLMIPEARLAALGGLAELQGMGCRYPFLEQGLVNAMNSQGPRAKTDRWMNRDLWSRLTRRQLPAWARAGHGTRSFMFPPGEVPGFVRAVLDRARVRRAGYFDPDLVAQMLVERQRSLASLAGLLWRVLAVQLWHEQLVDGRPRS